MKKNQTKPKASTTTSSRTSKAQPKRKPTQKKKTEPNPFAVKVVMVFIIALLAATLINIFLKNYILLLVFNSYCVQPEPGDQGARMIYDAINLHHQLEENPNKKEELLRYLSDEVAWYRDEVKSKESIGLKSTYDSFCFSSQPIYDKRDDLDRNYQLRFTGFHRYRLKSKNLIKIESYYAEIVSGKITQLIPKEPNQLEGDSPIIINSLYNNFFMVILILSFIAILALTYTPLIPEFFWNFLKDIFYRFFRIN